MIFFPPQAGSVFQSISAGLGIREVGREMYELPGIRMKTDFLLGGKGKDFMVEEPYESSLSLSLNEDCTDVYKRQLQRSGAQPISIWIFLALPNRLVIISALS